MKIALSSDEHVPLVDFISSYLKKQGHEIGYFGPQEGEKAADWPDVTQKAAQQVATQQVDYGICLCWTGTGASIAANKVKGIRAALCHDSETAKGARKWNHANVLVLSIRNTSMPIAEEILKTWFSTPVSDDNWNKKQIAKIKAMEMYFDH
ncbi:RpiB/LacA/LacB family sugar-phosphate isomerase [uncultured Shewanella sp.]|uniref:RpiB/LacA/LacB family sugar-phosphate isomerase n=1 Tax=uncultured Shewanella sp. TaxID=173975 RepID=UPI0026338C6F|nr:RpiB/LacA/LacB family sugar-phosphate isomerase [uncultured Shewanella sp.]